MTYHPPTQTDHPCSPAKTCQVTNRDLLLPYMAPYFIYVALSSLFDIHEHATWIYSLRVVITPVLLLFLWHHYISLTGPRNNWASIFTGISAGIIGCIIWIVLAGEFTDPYGKPGWSDTAFILRLTAASLFVPVFEELLMRGFVFRFALQWDQARKNNATDPLGKILDDSNISHIKPGEWSWFAILVSTTLFTLGHNMHEWPAAFTYSLLISYLWIVRKDLLSCIIAHGTTNFFLALYVRTTGAWGLW